MIDCVKPTSYNFRPYGVDEQCLCEWLQTLYDDGASVAGLLTGAVPER